MPSAVESEMNRDLELLHDADNRASQNLSQAMVKCWIGAGETHDVLFLSPIPLSLAGNGHESQSSKRV